MRLAKKYFHLKSNAVYNSSAKNGSKSLDKIFLFTAKSKKMTNLESGFHQHLKYLGISTWIMCLCNVGIGLPKENNNPFSNWLLLLIMQGVLICQWTTQCNTD